MSAIEHDEAALVKEVSPAEAAHLIDQLERGYQAAYRSAREAYGTSAYPPRRAMATDLDQLAGDEHWATFAVGMRQPGESVPQFLDRTRAEAAKETTQMSCPECGEDVQQQAPADLVNWQTHGLDHPEWSHRDGSSLCPVIGPSSGYQPARPRPAEPDREPDTDIARLDPPATMRSALDRTAHPDGPAAGARGQADRDSQQARPGEPRGDAAGYPASGIRAGQRGAIPRQYPADTTRRLDVAGPGPTLRNMDATPAASGRQAELEAGE